MCKHLGTHLKLTYSNLTVKLGIHLDSLTLALLPNTYEYTHATFFVMIYIICDRKRFLISYINSYGHYNL